MCVSTHTCFLNYSRGQGVICKTICTLKDPRSKANTRCKIHSPEKAGCGAKLATHADFRFAIGSYLEHITHPLTGVRQAAAAASVSETRGSVASRSARTK